MTGFRHMMGCCCVQIAENVYVCPKAGLTFEVISSTVDGDDTDYTVRVTCDASAASSTFVITLSNIEDECKEIDLSGTILITCGSPGIVRYSNFDGCCIESICDGSGYPTSCSIASYFGEGTGCIVAPDQSDWTEAYLEYTFVRSATYSDGKTWGSSFSPVTSINSFRTYGTNVAPTIGSEYTGLTANGKTVTLGYSIPDGTVVKLLLIRNTLHRVSKDFTNKIFFDGVEVFTSDRITDESASRPPINADAQCSMQGGVSNLTFGTGGGAIEISDLTIAVS